MNTILQATADLLKSKKYQPAFTEDGDLLLVPCGGEHLYWTTSVDTSSNGSVITLLSRVPVKVPPAKRGACARLLARINYGKRQGAFHLDTRDGEVLFCISNVLTAGIASEEMLDVLFGTTYSAMNEHATKIFKLVYGRGSASDAESVTPARDRHRSIRPPGLEN
ncbi:MAG TPA: YbjN domain-containing protein [Candidatus Paceibacterota bacterium]|nr:YbjN domain-containing protein [Verrucomicrobiota bacterium]HSA09635.1 YbjN domain-containing protein [Candidatus Paceibacterota bacterium]